MEVAGKSEQTQDRTAPRRRRPIFAVAALTIGCMLALLLAEIACRLVGLGKGIVYQRGLYRESPLPGVIYELTPSFDTYSYGWQTHINSFGCRGPELPAETADDVYRILCVGDSFTYGMGVADDQTWAVLLARMLPPPAGFSRVESVNMGVNGYNLAQSCAVIEHRARQLRPQLVVIAVTGNDLDPPLVAAEGYLCFPAATGSLPIPGKHWLQSHSYFYQFAALRYRQLLFFLIGNKAKAQVAPHTYVLEPDQLQRRDLVAALAAAQGALDGSCRLVALAVDLPPHSELTAVLAAAGCVCQPMTTLPERRLPDGHPDALGHAEFARQLAGWLLTQTLP